MNMKISYINQWSKYANASPYHTIPKLHSHTSPNEAPAPKRNTPIQLPIPQPSFVEEIFLQKKDDIYLAHTQYH